MLEPALGLPAATLDAIADLERRVIAVDGGRLKLEWGVLRSRTGQRVEDLLWWDGERLLGFLGIYAFGAPVAELTGMVDPAARRRGIATELLDAALPLCRERGYTKTLLVTPRIPTAAGELARRRGAVLDHCEYALELTGEPRPGAMDPRITLRPMTVRDVRVVNRLISIGFGRPEPEPEPEPVDDEAPWTEREDEQTLVVTVDGAVVATLRCSRDGDSVGVYGLVVHPDQQGQGIGRDVLRRVCAQARVDGATRVHLEVAVENDRALGLYTSLGFTPIATEDYYNLSI